MPDFGHFVRILGSGLLIMMEYLRTVPRSKISAGQTYIKLEV